MPRSATELMRLAIEEDPTQRPLWQFLLARTFEDDNATEFSELSQAFAIQFPNDEAMTEIDAMRKALSRNPGHSVPARSLTAQWNSSAFFGRDDGGQRLLHAALLQAIK